MFNFIKNKLKLKKIEKTQFRQWVIFIALNGGDYLENDELQKTPEKAKSFNATFGVSNGNETLRVYFIVNHEEYYFDINNKSESASYFINFLECTQCLKDLKNIVYVSSINDTKDFLYITEINAETLKIMLLSADKNKECLYFCIDKEEFFSKFIAPLAQCAPFDKYMQEAKKLYKYSSKKSLSNNKWFSKKKHIDDKTIKKWTIDVIKIYIAPTKFDEIKNVKYKNMVREAFEIWAKASGNKFNIEITENLYDSNINIGWKKVDKKALGSCHFNFDKLGRLYSAELDVGVFGKIADKYLDDIEIYHTILHLAGCALGVPQTDNPDDIMCIPHQYRKTELSDNDKKAIYNLYNYESIDA